MKSLLRLDYYVVMRIRLGADNSGHKECNTGTNQFHLVNYDKYEKDRLEPKSIHDDSKIPEWRKWFTYHNFLGMAIPMTLPDHINTQVRTVTPSTE